MPILQPPALGEHLDAAETLNGSDNKARRLAFGFHDPPFSVVEIVWLFCACIAYMIQQEPRVLEYNRKTQNTCSSCTPTPRTCPIFAALD